MELEEVKLRRTNVNYLHGALRLHRRQYDLLWCHGNTVKCSQVNFINQLDSTFSVQLHGERVIWCHSDSKAGIMRTLWSAPIDRHSNPEQFLAVVLDNRLEVLLFTSDNKIVKHKEVSEKVTPRGCSWHPSQPVLAIVSNLRAAVFRLTGDAEHVTLPRMTESFVSCAWSTDGKQLAVCSRNHLNVYSWQELEDLKHFSYQSWGSLNSVGAIQSTVAMGTSTFLLATEPLFNELWSAQLKDVFETNLNIGLDHKNCFTSDENSPEARVVAPRTGVSELGDSLLRFKLNSLTESVASCKAQLVVIHSKNGKLEKLCSSAVDSLLSPDLLLFEPDSNTAVVGSNSSGDLHVFSYSPETPVVSSSITKVRDIKLESKYKPKGLILVPGKPRTALVLLAIPKKSLNAAFPPSTIFEDYCLKLQCLDLSPAQLQDEQDHRVLCDVMAAQPSDELDSLRLPDGTVWQGADKVNTLISEVEGHPEEPFHNETSLDKVKGQEFLLEYIRKIERQLVEFHTSVRKQLSRLEAKLDAICGDGSGKRKPLQQYSTLDEAEFVHVEWTDGNEQKRQTFLLDNGRLKLDIVQKTFGATLVEICKDGHACIISAGEDGFIPVHFVSGSTVRLTGKS